MYGSNMDEIEEQENDSHPIHIIRVDKSIFFFSCLAIIISANRNGDVDSYNWKQKFWRGFSLPFQAYVFVSVFNVLYA